ncbi:MAG: hypothetical protein KDA80_06840 [Planctomycetaceae bacterium]|nr:hypothetical protein [Planctomycetaceae bacterium]
MKHLLVFAFACTLFMTSGCGGTKEVPALTEPGQDPPAEQQRDWMEESRKRGGAPSGQKLPGEEEKK